MIPEGVLFGDDVGILVAKLDVLLQTEAPSVTVTHEGHAVEHLENVVGGKLRRRLNVLSDDVSRLSKLKVAIEMDDR